MYIAEDITFDHAPSPQHPAIYTDCLVECIVSGHPEPIVSWRYKGRRVLSRKYWHKAHPTVTSVQRTLGKFYRFTSITRALCCWLGGRKGIRPVKTEWWGAGVVVCLERGAHLHMAQLMPLPLTVSCFSKIQIGFTFLVPAYPGCPGKEAVKW